MNTQNEVLCQLSCHSQDQREGKRKPDEFSMFKACRNSCQEREIANKTFGTIKKNLQFAIKSKKLMLYIHQSIKDRI